MYLRLTAYRFGASPSTPSYAPPIPTFRLRTGPISTRTMRLVKDPQTSAAQATFESSAGVWRRARGERGLVGRMYTVQQHGLWFGSVQPCCSVVLRVVSRVFRRRMETRQFDHQRVLGISGQSHDTVARRFGKRVIQSNSIVGFLDRRCLP